MDCTSTPTVVCELSRIASVLADKAPTWFEWLQLLISVAAAGASLAVAIVAVRIAKRSHEFAEQVSVDADERLQKERRAAFNERAQALINRLVTSSLERQQGPSPEAMLAATELITDSLAEGDAVQMDLARAVSALSIDLTKWPLTERRERANWPVTSLKTRIAMWVLRPDAVAAMSAHEWDATARRVTGSEPDTRENEDEPAPETNA